MRLIRALAALLLLAAILVGGPVVLWSLGADLAPADLTWTTLQNLLLTPDTTGGVFVVIITIIGWIAWALFTLCTLVELINRAAGIRIRLPGLGIGQKLAGGLVAAVLTISTLSTTAAPALADTPPPPPPSRHHPHGRTQPHHTHQDPDAHQDHHSDKRRPHRQGRRLPVEDRRAALRRRREVPRHRQSQRDRPLPGPRSWTETCPPQQTSHPQHQERTHDDRTPDDGGGWPH